VPARHPTSLFEEGGKKRERREKTFDCVTFTRLFYALGRRKKERRKGKACNPSPRRAIAARFEGGKKKEKSNPVTSF